MRPKTCKTNDDDVDGACIVVMVVWGGRIRTSSCSYLPRFFSATGHTRKTDRVIRPSHSPLRIEKYSGIC
jgi:hypothetical protein